IIETSADRAAAEIARLSPAETVVGDGSAFDELATVTRPRIDFDSASGEARLKRLFGVATLDGFGQFSRAALAAAGGLAAYLEHTAKGSLPFL
ncbi:DNA mismatch repair protein MutS, partial [Escherichia coli]|nr:DNA mismatch repair protein MutS [Escherichia coli]